jgi:hypothetical protein
MEALSSIVKPPLPLDTDGDPDSPREGPPGHDVVFWISSSQWIGGSQTTRGKQKRSDISERFLSTVENPYLVITSFLVVMTLPDVTVTVYVPSANLLTSN